MKQHQMTHKFRDSQDSNGHHLAPGTPDSKQEAGSSPFTSPASSEPLSPPYNNSSGVKRPAVEEAGVNLVDRQAEKRAILCG